MFLALFVGSLILSPYTYALLSLVVMTVAGCEYFRLSFNRRFTLAKVMVILAGILLFAGVFMHYRFSALAPKTLSIVAVSAVIPIFAAMISMMKDCASGHGFEPGLFFPLLYITVPVCASAPLCFGITGEYQPLLFLLVFVLIWANDIFAYVFGMSFGQKSDSRKLCPSLSPKKSVIGVVGGTVMTFVVAVPVWGLYGFRFFNLYHWAAVAALVSVFGVTGDLFESLIKRHAGVKDSGNAIPGHGGVLDRFDGSLFVIPAVTAYLYIIGIL